MAYASKAGRARVSSRSPQAFGVCDRCSIWYNHVDLRWQYQWAGAKLNNIRLLVCQNCYDEPQQQKRAIVLTADPLPVINARVEPVVRDEVDYRSVLTSSTVNSQTGLTVNTYSTRATEDGQTRSTQPIGPPTGLDSYAISPLNNKVAYGTTLSLTSIVSNGTTVVTVTCNTLPSGFAANSQVSIAGTGNSKADGFYSVTSVVGYQFTYTTNQIIPSANLLQSTTRIRTVIVGLPYEMTQIPQTGI